MITKLRCFKKDQSGAITADYVVLVGALLALSLSVVNAVKMGTFDGMMGILVAVETASDTGCVQTNNRTTTTNLPACE